MISPLLLSTVAIKLLALVAVSCCMCQAATLNVCGQVLQIIGRQPAELASSSYNLLDRSLPRMAARVCFLLEGGRTLPPALNTLMVKTDAAFLHYATVSQVVYHTG